MGRVTNERKARDLAAPCHGFPIVFKADGTLMTPDEVRAHWEKEGRLVGEDVMLFKEGVLGALTDEQDAELCAPAAVALEETPPGMRRRLAIIRGLEKGSAFCAAKDAKALALEALDAYRAATAERAPALLADVDRAIEAVKRMPEC